MGHEPEQLRIHLQYLWENEHLPKGIHFLHGDNAVMLQRKTANYIPSI
jgi:hypothetical protein